MNRSTSHATFTIEAAHDAPPHAVFRAFADPEIKRRWFAEGEGWVVENFDMDFRVGGRESCHFRQEGKDTPMTNDTVYLDIVEDERIVVAYAMTIGGKSISASLATLTFAPQGKGMKLTYTEQAAFLDGLDQVQSREAGCRWLMTEALASELKRQSAAA